MRVLKAMWVRFFESGVRAQNAMWCRLVHARFTAEPLATTGMPLWQCTCDVCGRVWAEED